VRQQRGGLLCKIRLLPPAQVSVAGRRLGGCRASLAG
jgi:hypothetical protein